jgi:hypothetical protein
METSRTPGRGIFSGAVTAFFRSTVSPEDREIELTGPADREH